MKDNFVIKIFIHNIFNLYQNNHDYLKYSKGYEEIKHEYFLARDIASIQNREKQPIAPDVYALMSGTLDWYYEIPSYSVFYLMETYDQNLSELLKQGITEDQQLNLFKQSIELYKLLHFGASKKSKNYLHIDVKMQNILVKIDTMQLALSDFGSSLTLNKNSISTQKKINSAVEIGITPETSSISILEQILSFDTSSKNTTNINITTKDDIESLLYAWLVALVDDDNFFKLSNFRDKYKESLQHKLKLQNIIIKESYTTNANKAEFTLGKVNIKIPLWLIKAFHLIYHSIDFNNISDYDSLLRQIIVS